MTNGFFLEAGAQNCEWSVTLPIEANFGWKGNVSIQKLVQFIVLILEQKSPPPSYF